MRRSASACEVCRSRRCSSRRRRRDVDRHDFERGSGIESLREHRLRNAVGILEDFLVIDRRTDGADDTLADAGDDRRLAGTATYRSRLERTVMRALTLRLNAVLRDTLEDRVSITFGLTEVCSASSTSRPARSMAAARCHSSGICARWARSSPASPSGCCRRRTCDWSWSTVRLSPLARPHQVLDDQPAGTPMMRMRISDPIDSGTPAAIVRIHSPSGK